MSEEKNWLDKNKVTEAFGKAQQERKGTKLDTLDFSEHVGVPIFFKIISENPAVREIEQTFPDPQTTAPVKSIRRIVDIEVLENSPDGLKKGETYSWWPNQAVVKTNLKPYEPLKTGQDFCVVCLGKIKPRGGGWPYWDYYIGTADEGNAIIENLKAGGK